MTFQTFLHSDEPTIYNAARILTQIEDSYAAGKLTDEECKELVQTALDFDHVCQLTDDIDLRAQVYEAFQALYKLAGAVLPLV